MAKSRNPSKPQSLEDQQGPGYENDAQGWVRGAAKGAPTCFDETAETKPGFDHSPPCSKMRR